MNLHLGSEQYLKERMKEALDFYESSTEGYFSSLPKEVQAIILERVGNDILTTVIDVLDFIEGKDDEN